MDENDPVVMWVAIVVAATIGGSIYMIGYLLWAH
jgi:hypothetical protein